MAQISTLFPLLLSITLVSGHLHSSDRTTRRKGEQMMEGGKTLSKDRDRQQRSVSSLGNPDCLEGNPLGASYSGNINVTTSGRTCQAWSAQEPHEHRHTELGEHNYCRNPNGKPLGVWCYTTDPDKLWEFCSVPICKPTYECQEGDPLGVTYIGKMNVTISGRSCQAWSSQEPHMHGLTEVGDHNYCRFVADVNIGGVKMRKH